MLKLWILKQKFFKKFVQCFPDYLMLKLKYLEIFVVPQVNTILKYKSLKEKMNDTTKGARQAFQVVVDRFLRNKRGQKLQTVSKMLSKHGMSHDCKTSFFMLPSRLLSRKNLSNFSVEHG